MTRQFNPEIFKQLYTPSPTSHKGQNGKLLIIGGSHLFHASTLWALKVSSRIVDMVFYSSTLENNEMISDIKQNFFDGIVVSRNDLDSYAEEADCILIGPGMVRSPIFKKTGNKLEIDRLEEINSLPDEGEQTYYLTKYILNNFGDKKIILDAGALQMLDL